jgi:HK97 family phage prohead protease
MNLLELGGAPLSIRDAAAREIEARIVPWHELAETAEGLERIERGAFDGLEPGSVVLRLDHADPAIGRGISFEDREDGAYMAFRVSATARGDELLALVTDGTYRGASIGFEGIPEATTAGHHMGRRITIRSKVNLREVSATWRPAYPSAAITQIRSEEMLNDPTADATTPAPVVVVPSHDPLERILGRLEAIEERARQDATAPPAGPPELITRMGDWAAAAMRQMAGEVISPLEMRALAEIITTTNLGVVPPAYSSELLGFIDNSRPFLESTRRLPTPGAGIQMIVPRLVTRPTVGVQVAEKDELTSTNTAIDTVAFGMATVGGAGNLSLQLLRRSSPEFLDLYVRLLAEAYAVKTDDLAVDALLAEAGVVEGGTIDPESLTLGAAYANAMTATNRPPDRIWLAPSAYAAFIDAKTGAGGAGQPLYPGLAQIGSITVGGNGGPNPMTLRPVIVPAMEDEAVDVIIGPSSGFGWAEDGTYTLQADNPAQAGRDVALVGMVWFAPLYPSAFTSFTLAA